MLSTAFYVFCYVVSAMTLVMGEKKDPFLLSNVVSKIYSSSFSLS